MGARRSNLQLARLFGIRVGADYSWLLVLFLVIFFFQDQFRAAGAEDTTAYLAAVVAAFLFFGSIIVHEMGHALAARREGIDVAGIDLFFFGGLMHMRAEPRTAGAEFRVAAAGPAATVLVIVAFAVAGVALEGGSGFLDAITFQADDVPIAIELIASIVAMNVFVLAFNLVPAYPLDGGRIARAAVWGVTGDRHRATRAAALLGRLFAWALIGLGLLLVFRWGQTFTGVYLAILGWLLGTQARGAAMQTAFTERLEGVTVADIMDAEPVTIPADLPAATAYEDFFLRYHGYEWFAVTEANGGYVGRAHRATTMEAAEGPNAARPIRELTGADADGRVRGDVPLEEVLTSEPLRRLGALMAVDADGRLLGVVTAEQVARALRTRLAPG